MSGLYCSLSRRQDVHDVFQYELDRTILEEFQDIFGVLGGGGYSILFPLFVGLGDDMPSILPFLGLCSERFVVVQVNGGGICGGLGRDSDRYSCVGDGVCHRLGNDHEEATEEIRSDGQSRNIFVAVVLIPLFPRFRCIFSLLGCFIIWV